MTFKSQKDLEGLSSKDIICAISQNNSITEIDEKIMTVVAKKLGYNKVKTTMGLMYLEGYGQPIGVDQFAQMIVKSGKVNCPKKS